MPICASQIIAIESVSGESEPNPVVIMAIGAMFGGDDGENGQVPVIAFEPGSSDLSPPEREKLDRMAEALAQKPALVLTITGQYDPVADGEGQNLPAPGV